MKFGEKYELLESLTTGAVETFAANDKVRGERVLVHIVDCAEQKADQTTGEWVLESFRRLAPEPAGPVLETGKYSGTQYAYLVTKPPDEAAIRSWIRRYEIQGQETRETATVKQMGMPVVPSAPPSPPVKSPEPAPMAGSMTQLFRDFDSQAREKQQPPAPKEAGMSPRAMPTTSLPGASGLHAAPPWDPVNVRPSVPPRKEDPSFSSSMNSAPADSMAKSAPPEPAMPPINDRSKPGEFTSFFQGPFRPDAPSELPFVSATPIEPPRKTVGEFTAVFGQVAQPDHGPSEPTASAGSGPSFTGLFKDMEGTPRPAKASVPFQSGVLSTPVEPLPPLVPPKDPFSVPQSPVFVAPTPVPLPSAVAPIPIPPSPPVVRPQNSFPGGAATGAFTRPTTEPPPAQPEVPSGPSPYTQIISRARFAENAAEAQEQSAANAAGGKAAAPAMPKIPAMAPPPMPKMPPPPPLLPPPAMPKLAAPAAPKIPKVAVPPPPPVSYMPLVITLTVLFFLAVLLVLYFALKH